MAERDIQKRFLNERKKSIKSEVAKVEAEYEAIVGYLNKLLLEARSLSNDLVKETNYATFVQKFGPAVNNIQDVLSKFILVRLSLPDEEEPTACADEDSASPNIADVKREKLMDLSPPPPPAALNPPAAAQQRQGASAVPVLSGERDKQKEVLKPEPSVAPTLLPRPSAVPSDRDSKQNIVTKAALSPPISANQQGTGASVRHDDISHRSAVGEVHLSRPAKKLGDLPQLVINNPIFRIQVVELLSPWLFWVRNYSNLEEMEDFNSKLEVYHQRYDWNDPRYRLEGSKLRTGELVSAQFNDSIWYRARIVSVFGSYASHGRRVSKVTVFYIDYGNNETVTIDKLRPLPAEFLDLPAQAFACSIPMIGPANTSIAWPDAVIEELNHITTDSNQQEICICKPNARLYDCPLVFVDIYLDCDQMSTQSKITRILTGQGLARPFLDLAAFTNWYRMNSERTIFFGGDVIESLRWIDVHRLQKPEVYIDDDDWHSAEENPSMSAPSVRGYIVNHVKIETPHHGIGDAVNSRCKFLSPPTSKDCKEHEDGDFGKVEKCEVNVQESMAENLRPAYKVASFVEKSDGKVPTSRAMHVSRNVVDEGVKDCHSQEVVSMQKLKMIATQNWLDNSCTATECVEDMKINVGVRPDSNKNTQESHTYKKKLPAGEILPSDESGRAHSKSSRARNNDVPTKLTNVGKHGFSGASDLCDEPVRDRAVDNKSVTKKAIVMNIAVKSPASVSDVAVCGTSRESSTINIPDLVTSSTAAVCEKAAAKVEPVASKPSLKIPQPLPESSPNTNEMEEVETHWANEGLIESNDPCLPAGLPPCKLVVPDDGCFSVVMSEIESPGRFWVHALNNDVNRFDWLETELFKYAGRLANNECDNKPVNVELYAICCARSRSDGNLYRAEITGICYDTNCEKDAVGIISSCKCINFTCHSGAYKTLPVFAVRAFFLDYGSSEWNHASEMLFLPDDLWELPPMAICMQLADVVPFKGDIFEEGVWTKEAIDNFKSLISFEKSLCAVVDRNVLPGSVIGPTTRKPLRVTLMDLSVSDSVSINDRLVEEGLASVKICEQDKSTWNPMANEYFSERNSYKVDVDDPAVATVGYRAHDEDRICRFFNMRGGCWKGDSCPNEHVRYSDIKTVTNDKQTVFYVSELDFMVDLPSAGSWVLVQVTHIFSPSHVCVVFPYGTKPYSELLKSGTAFADGHASELEKHHEELHKFYSRKTFANSDLTLFGSGEMVVAKFSGTNQWYRARVIGQDSDHNVQVLYIDYGNREWLSPDRIREMEPQFMTLPSQAVHCYLPIAPITMDYKWDPSARVIFKELVAGKILTAHILNSGFDGNIHAELHDGNRFDICEQLINFDFAQKVEKVWPPSIELSSPRYGEQFLIPC